jgi:cereblon
MTAVAHVRASGEAPKEGAPKRAPGDEPLIDRDRPLRCRRCGAAVADERDVIVMGRDAVQVFFNPHGYLHELFTVRRARGLAIEGERTAEFSWFPGYTWRIAYCERCGAHLGWLFEAERSGAEPPSFYGLRRSEVTSGE